MSTIDLARAVETFAAATDLTVGLEEEFQILDPGTLELAPRFEELRDEAASFDPRLHEHITGELISSEIEIISGPGADLADALSRQRERRRALFALAAARGACAQIRAAMGSAIRSREMALIGRSISRRCYRRRTSTRRCRRVHTTPAEAGWSAHTASRLFRCDHCIDIWRCPSPSRYCQSRASSS